NISAKAFPINANAYMYDKEGGAHGHNFFIMGMGYQGNPDPSKYNYINPPLRDTVTLPGDGKLQTLKMPPSVKALCQPGYQHTKRLAIPFPDDGETTVTPGGYVIPKSGSTKRLAIPSPDDGETTVTPGGYVIPKSGSTKRSAIPSPDDGETTVTPGGYVIPNQKEGFTKRLAIPSPDDDNVTTVTPGGYVIPKPKEGSTKVKRTTERNIKYTTKRNAWKW
ncbi:23608_t:CDS:2, partial [Gigaspora margarita]